MSTALTQSALVRPSQEPPPAKRRLPLLPVAALLEQQSQLTAVERFAQVHESCDIPRQSRYYRDLIPLGRPKFGEQYGFEVDLDQCTGCKACVSACHSLNGLDPSELWRTVGLLHGGTPAAPALQTVTTSCHHCLEPACLSGCPVRAYEKDPITGIVKHLSDQCFGCQYCTLMCPYDAPKYNPARGIVRKCDMCSDRLAHDEAPACVQACPNQAIAIRIVDQRTAVEAGDSSSFVPGAPTPEHTLPTTVYKTSKPMPNNMLPADFYAAKPEHAHPALVVMLVLTQLSVGAFASNLLIERLFGTPAGSVLWQSTFAVALALLALFSSLFHLGRPQFFYRAFLGLRTSWLSREVIAFGLFAKLALLYAALAAAPFYPDFPGKSWLVARTLELHVAAASVGILGVLASVMVYVATRRPQWSAAQTGIKFIGSMLALGAAAVLAVGTATAPNSTDLSRDWELLLALVLGASLVKLTSDAWILRHRRDRQRSSKKRIAYVMLADLRAYTAARFGFGVTGGILLPLWLLSGKLPPDRLPFASTLLFLCLLAGEFAERYLFFRAAPASRMPGGLP